MRISLFSKQLFLALSLVALSYAQTPTGEIDVTVTDPSGAIVNGAQVKLTGSLTGNVARTLTTNDAGIASAPLLKPGLYDITVTKPGFRTFVRKQVEITVGSTLNVPLRLQVGAATQEVTVVGQPPLLQTTSGQLGQVVNDKTMESLPLNGRNYLQLGLLAAGTVPSPAKDSSFSAYGNRGIQNVFLIDGALNENYMRGLDTKQRDAMRPSLDAIQEFDVETNTFSAQYGSSAGGVVTVVTKSGTNQIHGSAFDFLENSSLDARDYFAPPGPVPILQQNQFGGSLGGPLKKDRAWLFGAYQGTQIRQENTYLSTVPLLSMRQGNFGNTPIFNPFTTVGSGSQATRQPFPNNTIPASLMNSVGLQLLSKYPDPNLPGLANNFAQSPKDSNGINNATFRGDVQVTSKSSMFARLSFNLANTQAQPALPPPADTPVNQNANSWSVGYGFTHVFGPTMVNEFRFAWNRLSLVKDGTLGLDPIIPGSLAPQVDSSTPTFNLSGFAGLGATPPCCGNVPLNKSSSVWDVADNLSKTSGHHSFKFGADVQYIRLSTFATLSGRGSFTFDGTYSQDPLAPAGTGSSVADILLGLAERVTTGTPTTADERGKNYAFFAQDDWKITPRLTLNFGLRYELYLPYTETQNRIGDFILNPADPNFGHIVYPGVTPGISAGILGIDTTNFAPRFGFAYQVPGVKSLVIRGGYGIFYGQDEGNGVSNRITNNPPFVGLGGITLIGDHVTPASAFDLSGTLPARPVPPSPQNFVLNPNATNQLISWYPHYTTPYVQEWNLTVEKELPGNIVWQVNYVGNIGVDLWGGYQGNQPLQPGPGAVNNRRPLSVFTKAPVLEFSPWDISRYQGISTRLEKRMSHGLTFLFNFTHGQSLDYQTYTDGDICFNCGISGDVQNAYDLRAQHGRSDDDIPNRVVLSGDYQLPFGTGRKFLGHGWAGAVAGNWDISSIWTAEDGQPFTVGLSFDNANVGNSNWANRLCTGSLANPSPTRWFNASCFATPAQYTFGNSGRNILFGPGEDNIDFALHRIFQLPMREGMQLEFRGEFFNVLNHPEFGQPNATIGVPATARVSSTKIPNRITQLALKLIW